MFSKHECTVPLNAHIHSRLIPHPSFSGNFTLTQHRNLTIYFRAWSTGFFFVDDVSVVRRQCAPAVPDSFALGPLALKPLNFTPPIVVEDLLLCGYCDLGEADHRRYDPAFNKTRICDRCRSANMSALLPPPPASQPLVLDDFTPGHAPLFYPNPACWNYTHTPGANRSMSLAPNCFLDTNAAYLPRDWSRHAYLRVRYQNNFLTPQQFYVEIDDCHSTNYYSRVNWYTYLVPGSGEAVVPLDAAVGEKAQVGVVRRRLDLRCITRIAPQWINAAAAADARVEIQAFYLTPRRPFVHDFPELLKIDVQPPTAPVAPLFTGLYGTPYTDLRGYGATADVSTFEASDRQHPTRLLRDWISFEAGGLRFRLPNGSYGVWLCMEDAGGMKASSEVLRAGEELSLFIRVVA